MTYAKALIARRNLVVCNDIFFLDSPSSSAITDIGVVLSSYGREDSGVTGRTSRIF